MNTETALSNVTASKSKVNKLFELKKITLNDLDGLSPGERVYLNQTNTQKLGRLKGEERDRFLAQIDPILSPATKSDIWDYNNQKISNAISSYMSEYGVMPAQSTIVEETGLSRQTVSKHFKEYKAKPEFIAQMEQFKFMAPKMLANVFKAAGTGDMRAARLYFEMVGAINKPQNNTVVNGQNNYIQINNTILSQENLKQLSEEQLKQIESIITNNG